MTDATRLMMETERGKSLAAIARKFEIADPEKLINAASVYLVAANLPHDSPIEESPAFRCAIFALELAERLVVAERERCARIAEDASGFSGCGYNCAELISEEIRKRTDESK